MRNPTPSDLERERNESVRLTNKCLFVIGRLNAIFGLNPDTLDPHLVEAKVLSLLKEAPSLTQDRARLEWFIATSGMSRGDVDAAIARATTAQPTPEPTAVPAAQ